MNVTPETTITISFILTIVSAVGVIFSIYNGTKNAHQAESDRTMNIERNFVKVNVKLDNLCDQVSDIKKVQQHTDEELEKINGILVRHDERIESIDSRVSRLENKN